jgi:hypothetical protein
MAVRRSEWINQWFNPKSYLVVGGLVLLAQDWQVAFSLLAGALVMFGVYGYQESGGAWLRKLSAFWASPQRPLVVAVIMGSFATIVVQMITAIWMEVPNHWLAGAITLQLVATLAVLFLLIRNSWQGIGKSDPLAGLVEQLLSDDAGDRLLALRELSKHLQTNRVKQQLPPAQQKMIIDLCETVMSQEPLPVVQRAAQQTLNLLRQ